MKAYLMIMDATYKGQRNIYRFIIPEEDPEIAFDKVKNHFNFVSEFNIHHWVCGEFDHPILINTEKVI